MFELCCDDPLAERELRALTDLIGEAGGWIHPDVRISQRGPDLSVGSTLAPERRDPLVCLPEPCLPDIAQFELAVEGDEFVIRSHEKGIDPRQVRIFEKTVALWNIIGKAHWQRRTCLWFTLAGHPEILATLAEARRGNQKIDKLHEHAQHRDDQRLLIDSFLGNRVGQGLRNAGARGGNAASYRVLMPIVDFVNHNWQSPTYKNVDRDNRPGAFISVLNSKPVPGSDESFVLYNLLDALDSYLMYDFVETEAPFVRSVPVRFKLDNGKEIEALGAIGPLVDKAALAAQVRDLWMYVPSPFVDTAKHFQVSALLIPGSAAPFALRRVLAMLIQHMTRGLTPPKLEELVLEFERTVLEANMSFYRGLESSIAALDDGGKPEDRVQLKRLIDVQCSKLRQYADRLKLKI